MSGADTVTQEAVPPSVPPEQPRIPHHGLRASDNDFPEVRVSRIQEHVHLPSRNNRRNDQHGRSLLAYPGIAEGSGNVQVRMIPPDRQAALAMLLHTHGSRDRNLDCHVRSGHAPDTRMSQALQHGARVGAAGIDDSEAR